MASAVQTTLPDKQGPSLSFKLLRILDRPTSTSADVAEVLEAHPTLPKQILKMARSPLCGVRSPDLTVGRAIVLLGFVTVRKLVVLTLCRELGSIGDNAKLHEWKHALWVGITAEEIARRVDETLASEALMAGMMTYMHDAFEGHVETSTAPASADAAKMERFVRAAESVASLIIQARPGLPSTTAIDESLEEAGLMPLYDGRLGVDIRRGFEVYASLMS